MEELRSKHKSLHNAAHHIALECINPQSHSPYHVHPYPSPVRLQHAFQNQSSPKMFHPKGLKPHIDARSYGTPTDSPILGRALCLTPRGSPTPGRVSHLSDKFRDSLSLAADTDALVAKIGAMFPTVAPTHIKILLNKYYNREAVVISALQVEKHPITTPGPVTMSPCAARMQKGAMGVYSALQLAKGVSGSIHSAHLTPLSGTPQGSPSLLRPASGASSHYGARSTSSQPMRHSSPKMKLKYLKSVFPKAEETLILDVLANKDNNVQQASEELMTMGFCKKEIVKKKEETPQPAKKVIIVKTAEEKNELKKKLQKKYSAVAERVVSIALDSVDYNEERAEQILAAVLTDEPSVLPVKSETPEPKRSRTPEVKPGPILKTSSSESKYKSHYTSVGTGPNLALRRGPKDSLLLEDYMAWKGPNPDLRKGPCVKARGPEPRERGYSLARGPADLAGGPAGLNRGSMYAKMNKKTAKIDPFLRMLWPDHFPPP